MQPLAPHAQTSTYTKPSVQTSKTFHGSWLFSQCRIQGKAPFSRVLPTVSLSVALGHLGSVLDVGQKPQLSHSSARHPLKEHSLFALTWLRSCHPPFKLFWATGCLMSNKLFQDFVLPTKGLTVLSVRTVENSRSNLTMNHKSCSANSAVRLDLGWFAMAAMPFWCPPLLCKLPKPPQGHLSFSSAYTSLFSIPQPQICFVFSPPQHIVCPSAELS